MNANFTKVLERLNYERLLFSSGVTAKRRPITLDEVLQAAAFENRIYAVLPAIYFNRPQVIKNFERDLKKNPKLGVKLKNFHKLNLKEPFFGVTVGECLQHAETYRRYLMENSKDQKQLMRTFRFSYADLERLKRITKKLNLSGMSQTIRYLSAQFENSQSQSPGKS